jgi:hypothetical protein
VGKGNNAQLIEKLMQKRKWWKQLTNTGTKKKAVTLRCQKEWKHGEFNLDTNDA